MAVNLIVWSGIALYLFLLDRRVRKLEDTGRNENR